MTSNNSAALRKLALLFLVITGLYFAKSFLIPLALGAVLAMLFLPLCAWMERKKLHRGIAALFCLLILILVIGGIGTLLGWQISELANDFGLVKLKIDQTIKQVNAFLFYNLGITPNQQAQLLDNEQGSVGGMIRSMAGSVVSIVSYFILILVYVFLLLYYRTHLKQFILKLSIKEHRKEMEVVIRNIASVSQQYLVGLAKMIVCLWIMYGIGFSVLGVKNAIFFAVLCGLLEIVPYVGNITGTTLTLLVAMVHGASPIMLVGIVGTYGVVQFIQGWILEPLILGPQVRINPLFTIIALVLGQLIWGIPGVFLAIPIIAMVKIVCDHVDSLQPYGFLIGEIRSNKTESSFILKVKGWLKKK